MPQNTRKVDQGREDTEGRGCPLALDVTPFQGCLGLEATHLRSGWQTAKFRDTEIRALNLPFW